MNEQAPAGHAFVCMACGKTSADKYGNAARSYGWDVSCMLHAQCFPLERLLDAEGTPLTKIGQRVTAVKEEEPPTCPS